MNELRAAYIYQAYRGNNAMDFHTCVNDLIESGKSDLYSETDTFPYHHKDELTYADAVYIANMIKDADAGKLPGLSRHRADHDGVRQGPMQRMLPRGDRGSQDRQGGQVVRPERSGSTVRQATEIQSHGSDIRQTALLIEGCLSSTAMSRLGTTPSAACAIPQIPQIWRTRMSKQTENHLAKRVTIIGDLCIAKVVGDNNQGGK